MSCTCSDIDLADGTGHDPGCPLYRPDGSFDWPHAVGGESKAELIAEIGRLHEESARLRGLLEAADEFIYLARNLNSRGPTRSRLALARYDKLKGK